MTNRKGQYEKAGAIYLRRAVKKIGAICDF
jgi:hypothetical protein